MGRFTILLVVAGLPLLWQPLWGDAPRVREDVTKKPKQKAEPTTSQPHAGTEASPFIVEIQPRPESKTEAAKTQADKEQAARVERWMLIFTGAAALFTGLLVIVGYRGVRAANETLKAIEKQTNHIVNSERAWVVVIPDQSAGITGLEAGMMKPYNFLRADLVNKGKTVARIMEISWRDTVIGPNESLPDIPTYHPTPPGNWEPRHGAVVVPENPERFPMSIHTRISTADVGPLGDWDMALYVYGIIRYFDLADIERRNQFCYRYIEGRDHEGRVIHWIRDGPHGYNSHS
jgi:hypothetical protein